MFDVLIDSTGNASPINGGILHQNFGASTRNLALPGFVVRNLGFVRVRTLGDSAVVLFCSVPPPCAQLRCHRWRARQS